MDKPNRKEWTVMFYFASDNPIAPGVVSQLKAIKQAGFHPEANVIAQFDPQTVGTPTHIFEVNLINKLKSHGTANIGFDGNDPFVRNMLEDKLWRDQTNRRGRLLRDELEEVLERRVNDIDYDPPVPPDDRITTVPPRTGRSRELPPKQSLDDFLTFCVHRYPAKHYMLFILGHGVVVGNDVFLFDEHVSDNTNTLSLSELGEVLAKFTREVKSQKSEFELIGFHSCSVSSLEVAYQLKGTANYMLASQGPSFVGSWPYRQILIRLFNDLVKCGGRINVKRMLVKIFFYCLFNSSDFLLAGYSYDLCLCNLKQLALDKCRIKRPLQGLSWALKEGLKDCQIRNLILLAHWRAQSFWQESYTDLYDFCFCLRRLCEEYGCLNKPPEEVQRLLTYIQEACRMIINALMPDPTETGGACEDKPIGEEDKAKYPFIVRAAFAGPAYQYSHGLSVYFPWSRPVEDTQILEEYKRYKFAETNWLAFLEDYFDMTLRQTRKDEEKEEYALEYARQHDASQGDSHKALCEIYVDACKRQEVKKDDDDCQHGGDVEKPKPPSDPEERFRELLEDIASLVYYDEGQLSNSYALSGPKTSPRDPIGDDDCTCPSIKNYPHDTRARVERATQACSPVKASILSDVLTDPFI